jgi:hypothetical protein
MRSVADSLNSRFESIDALEFSLLKAKLAHPEQGLGWTQAHADQVEQAYKQYLKVVLQHPEERVSPSMDVDKFWHAHILDTQRYVQDCERIFGYFLHHYPYAGMLDHDGDRVRAEAAYRLQALTGGVPGAAWCWAAKPAIEQKAAWCWAAKPAVEQKAAWCWAAKPAVEQKAAWCWAAKPAIEQKVAWCWAAKSELGHIAV